MKRLRAVWRLLRVVLHLLGGVWTIYTVVPRLSLQQKHARVQVWALEMLDCLAIKLVVKGSPPLHGPMLMVANHISWVDIVVMHAARHYGVQALGITNSREQARLASGRIAQAGLGDSGRGERGGPGTGRKGRQGDF